MSRINLEAKTATEKRVLDYLEDNASDVLAEKINTGTKTLAGALSFAKGEAKKIAAGAGCVCVDDATVFGWIIHFFEEADIAEKKAVPAMRTPGGAVIAKPAPKKPVAQPMSMIDEILM